MKNIYLLFVCILFFENAKAQTPQLAWTKTFGSKSAATDSTSVMKMFTTDNSVYIVGTSDAWGKGNDIVLIKRDFATGDTIWTRRYNGPANGDDQAVDMVINQTTGDIYVTGKSMGNSTAYDVITIKYALNGTLFWAKRWDNDLNHGDDIPKSIGIDKNSNVYVGGTSYNGKYKLEDILIIKYDINGNAYHNTTNLDDTHYDNYSRDFVGGMKVSNNGEVFSTGQFLIGENTNGYSIAYSFSQSFQNCGIGFYCGNVYNYSYQCIGSYLNPSSGFPKGVTISSPDDLNSFNAMDLDNSNNVYLAYLNDTIQGQGNGYCVRIAKVNGTGCQVWEKKYGKSSNAKNIAVKTVKVDSNGNVYAAGFEKNSSGNFDWFVIKYNSNGGFNWRKTKQGTANGHDIPFDLAFDTFQNPILVGMTTNMNTNRDITIVKYNKSNGTEVFSFNYDSNNKDECAYNIAIDGSNGILVNGIQNSSVQNSKMLTLKYCNPPAAAEAITGTTTICQGQNSLKYTIPEIENATSYVWTLPTGATGISTTNSITVNYSLTATSGNITVKGRNDCSEGVVSTLPIIINQKPATPTVTINGSALHSTATAGNQWYNQTGAITGATTQDYTPKSSGDYYVIVSVNSCSSNVSNTMHFIPTGIASIIAAKLIKLYPNPVTNELTIELEDNMSNTTFEILNSIGQTVFTGTIYEKAVVQTANFAPGVYLIKLGSGKTFEFKKIIKK